MTTPHTPFFPRRLRRVVAPDADMRGSRSSSYVVPRSPPIRSVTLARQTQESGASPVLGSSTASRLDAGNQQEYRQFVLSSGFLIESFMNAAGEGRAHERIRLGETGSQVLRPNTRTYLWKRHLLAVSRLDLGC